VAAQPTEIETVLTVFVSTQRANVKARMTKTVETVLGFRRFLITPLKRGVNERLRTILEVGLYRVSLFR
jgi:hypothetical protein